MCVNSQVQVSMLLSELFGSRYRKNRKRFNDVLSGSEGRALLVVYDKLREGFPVADEVIVEAFERYWSTVQTNCISAAELHLVIVAPVCFYRPHLVDKLIRAGLLSLVYIGHERSDHVLNFVSTCILGAEAEPYGGLPSKEGVVWLRDRLSKDHVELQRILDEVIAENNKELEEM